MLEDKDIGFLLHKADMAAKNNFTNRLNEFGITPGQLGVLKEIYNNNLNEEAYGLAPACIAERMGCDRPTMTGVIERLEAQGWIIRIPNPEDKRSFIIQLSDKARNNLNELNKINKEHQDMILKNFNEEEILLFKNYLHRILNTFQY